MDEVTSRDDLPTAAELVSMWMAADVATVAASIALAKDGQAERRGEGE